jgi:hypothetical protein
MLNLALARPVTGLTINTKTQGSHVNDQPNQALSADSSAPPTLPTTSSPLLFGPIWVREAQRIGSVNPTPHTAAIGPAEQTSPDAESPTSPVAALKDIFCQPPTEEVHRIPFDMLFSPYLLGSSFTLTLDTGG